MIRPVTPIDATAQAILANHSWRNADGASMAPGTLRASAPGLRAVSPRCSAKGGAMERTSKRGGRELAHHRDARGKGV